MKFLITGKNGQLAQSFIRRFEERSYEFSAPGEDRLDITDPAAVNEAVSALKPDVIINCAAYNLVDKAEQDRDAVIRVNATGPKNLAQAALEQKAFLVHFGSDYVFDGSKENGLYTEDDPTNPLNVYGRSKLDGEQHVLDSLDRSLVFRLSWVFGRGKQNFIHKLIEWAGSSEYLKIACDEFSVPTSTETVVDVALQALDQGLTGRYHLTNSGYCSRYEWAKFILAALGIRKFVRPVSMDSFQLPARRPKFSAMSNERIRRTLGMRRSGVGRGRGIIPAGGKHQRMNTGGNEATAGDLRKANILVTGGAGFIGSNFIRYAFSKSGFAGTIVNYDKLTYAGNLFSLEDIERKYGNDRYLFERGDIKDYEQVGRVIADNGISMIVHFAAESHVDRSIFGPKEFIETNINGTFSLLEAARRAWNGRTDVRFHHISTDEVYGSLGDTGSFLETTPYDPRSPYSASKASSDHLVRAYFHTYGLPVTISNCSNNYGPYQFPEKLIPLILLNALEGKPLPVYGDGKNVRDWLYVDDHCEAIWTILEKGTSGETYNIGGECEKQNVEVVNEICDVLEELYPLARNSLIPQSAIRNPQL